MSERGYERWSEIRALLRLAGPMVLSQVAFVLMGLVDTAMSGHAGAQEQAVVGLGVALWIPIFIGLMNVVQAVSPFVARHYGAGDHQAIVRDTREAMWLALWTSLVPLAALPFVPAMLRAFGIEPELAEKTTFFLEGIGCGLPAALMFRAIAFYSASVDRPKPIMTIAFLGLGINAFFNWVLIYGRLGAPALGGAGCGWATAIGMWCSLVVMGLWTAFAPAYAPFRLWRGGWSWPSLEGQKRLLRLGLPMGGAGLAEVAAFTGIAVLIGRFGPVQIAAHQVALNVASLLFMLPAGIGAALAIRVGQSLGAGDPARARRLAWTGVAVGLAVGLLTMGPVLAGRHAITALYSSDPAVRDLAASLLVLAALWQVFDATQACMMGALRGYHVTLLPMLLMLGAFWLVGIPLGAWLGYEGGPFGRPLGVFGFWIGLLVGLALVSCGLALILRTVAEAALSRCRTKEA